MKDLPRLLRHVEKLDTAIISLGCTDDLDAARAEVIHRFHRLCTDAGKVVDIYRRPDWPEVPARFVRLRCAAVQAHNARAGTFSHIGAETGLVTYLAGFAAVLGLLIDDAATAEVDTITHPEDQPARDYVEGHAMAAE